MFGFGYKNFAMARKPARLKPSERRVFIPAEDLQDTMAKDLNILRRSCIIDDETGESQLEVIWSGRKALFEMLDGGSIGLNYKFFMYGDAGVRGSFQIDPCHTRHNRLGATITLAELRPAFHEGSLLIGFRKGPHAGAAPAGGGTAAPSGQGCKIIYVNNFS